MNGKSDQSAPLTDIEIIAEQAERGEDALPTLPTNMLLNNGSTSIFR